MKIYSASVDELHEGAKLEFGEGRICAARYESARRIYVTALATLRELLSLPDSQAPGAGNFRVEVAGTRDRGDGGEMSDSAYKLATKTVDSLWNTSVVYEQYVSMFAEVLRQYAAEKQERLEQYEAAEGEYKARIDCLAMFVRRLYRKLIKHEPDTEVIRQAKTYLKAIGQASTPLRVEEADVARAAVEGK